MENIITQAPIQVRENTTHKHERLFPLLVAEAINRSEEYLSGHSLSRVDIWNTQGLKIEQQYNDSASEYTSREQYIGHLITQRYDLLAQHYGILSDDRVVVRDDDQDVQAIVHNEVGALLESGVFQQYEEKFSHCNECDRIIAPVVARVERCPSGADHTISERTKSGLFMPVSDAAKTWIADSAQLNSPQARSLLRSAVHNMPPMIQMSKQREYGISLSEYGVDDSFVLDPLIVLSMMKKVIYEKQLGELDTVVLGRDTIKNYIPYSLLTGNGTNVKYVATGLIPPYTLEDTAQTPAKSSFYFPYLPLLMTGQIRDLTPTQLEAYQREHSKLQRKFTSSLAYMESLQSLPNYTEDIKTEHATLLEVSGDLKDYNMRDAMLKLREYVFEDISRTYIEACKRQSVSPNKTLISELKDLYTVLNGHYE